MKNRLSWTMLAAVLLGCVACSSSGPTATIAPRSAIGTASAPADGTGGTPAGAGSGSAFCDLARRLGTSNLGVSEGNLDANPKRLLHEVDELDAVAPADLKHDFDVYTAFEHAVLEPGSQPQSTVQGDNAAALEHVSAYLSGTCRITG